MHQRRGCRDQGALIDHPVKLVNSMGICGFMDLTGFTGSSPLMVQWRRGSFNAILSFPCWKRTKLRSGHSGSRCDSMKIFLSQRHGGNWFWLHFFPSEPEGGRVCFLKCTLPETNISPENRLLEKEIPIGNHNF